jgi:hypothetical protein
MRDIRAKLQAVPGIVLSVQEDPNSFQIAISIYT